jgi:phosphoribosylformimino-5-aminoimidazole carboxamide ribotide isomerase
MHGQVVRGVAGRRAEYRPIVSTLTTSADPVDVARALRDHFGTGELYLADLDAIGGAEPAERIYDSLHNRGFHLWVDAGVRSAADVSAVAAMSVGSVVVGLETVHGPDVLAEAVRRIGRQRVVFSLDLRDGQPLTDPVPWGADNSWGIAARVMGAGIRRLLVLDLARVGVGAGVGTEEFCARLRQAYPQLQIAAGGGIRGDEDVRRLYVRGVDYVLVASAMHDGRLTGEQVARLMS